MQKSCAVTGGLAMVTGLFLLGPGPGNAASEPRDELYDVPKVLALRIELPVPNLEALRREPRIYVKGTVREGDRTYANVGIRLKGAASVRLFDKKPSLAVKFDEFETNQLFHGHDRVSLNNALQDPTYLCEALGGELFRAAGVPAPKTTFARVELNGRDVGLYVVAQALNRDFLTDFFRKTKGNFYEGNHHDVTEKLDRDSGSGPKDQADLKKLVEAAREVHPGERLRKLGAVLDLDRFLAFLACEVFTGHRTGYALARDHYRVYHDPTSDRLVFMPEALDALFGGAKDPLVPECHGLVARAVLDSPEGQRLYRAQMATLLASVFKADALQHRLNEWAGRIRPALARDANETRAFEAGVAHLRETVALRAKFLEDELKKPPK